MLEEDRPTGQAGPIIIGVGPSQLFGEGELTGLLERLWENKNFPVAVICHAQADQTLLRWVKHEFPQLPEFPDTWAGGVCALETALRQARQRTLV